MASGSEKFTRINTGRKKGSSPASRRNPTTSFRRSNRTNTTTLQPGDIF